VIVRTSLELPDPNLHCVLVVETDMPMTEKDEGYDPKEFGAFVDAVTDAMNRIGAEKAEISRVEVVT
jgi:hypothetical protein